MILKTRALKSKSLTNFGSILLFKDKISHLTANFTFKSLKSLFLGYTVVSKRFTRFQEKIDGVIAIFGLKSQNNAVKLGHETCEILFELSETQLVGEISSLNTPMTFSVMK